MSAFSNINFINQILQESGVLYLSQEIRQMLQIFVQIQVKKLIRHSLKFMYADRQDELDFDHVQSALFDLNHRDILLAKQPERFIKDGTTFIRNDPQFKTTKQFIEEELKAMQSKNIMEQYLKGRWIYIDGKVPRINQNINLKNKSQILLSHQRLDRQKDKKFNIITDCPQNLLTAVEEEYFTMVTCMLSTVNEEDVDQLKVIDTDGDISNLLPMILNYLNSTNITKVKMAYCLKLLDNKFIVRSIEFYLHQILAYLWAYEGRLSYKVGLKIGSIIRKFGSKYPVLYKLEKTQSNVKVGLNDRQKIYSTLLKQLGIEHVTGIQLNVDEDVVKKCKEDALEGSHIAIDLMETMNENHLHHAKTNETLSIFSLPQVISDPSLLMTI